MSANLFSIDLYMHITKRGEGRQGGRGDDPRVD